MFRLFIVLNFPVLVAAGEALLYNM